MRGPNPILDISNRSLILVGIIILTLSALSILKFFIYALAFLLPTLYSTLLMIMGIFMMVSGISFYVYGKKYGGSLGMMCMILIISVGIGYILLGYFVAAYSVEPTELNYYGLGIALTIVKTALFFYCFLSIFLFFEARNGSIGGYGGLLILFFSSTSFFYVFSIEFLRTIPGAIITSLSGIGYILQGIALDRIFEPPKFRYPLPTRRPLKLF